MKKIVLIICTIFYINSMFAQVADTTKKMAAFKQVMGQYYFEAGMHIGQIFSTKAGMYTHFSGNVVLYKKYHLGAQYERLTSFSTATLFKNDSIKIGNYTFMHQSAGIRFNYAFFHQKKYQLQPGISINWAMIQYRKTEFDIRKWNFCMIEPGLTFSYILHKNVSLGAGFHYRINLGLSQALSNKDLNGFYGNIFVRFGLLQ